MRTFKLSILLFFICISASFNLHAQYLKGAVSEVGGKVIFNKLIETNLSDDKLFELMDKWLKDINEGLDPTKNRVAISDPEKREIACVGEKVLTFKASALSLDRAYMTYQLVVSIHEGNCDMTFRNIRYKYQEASKNTIYTAEEMITDKVALNKEGTKLNRFYDKFRILTIDSINSFFNSAEIYLNGRPAIQGASTQTSVSVTSAVSEISNIPASSNDGGNKTSLTGYKRIDADKIPGNIIKLLSDWSLITSGSSTVNTMTASWGGLGTLWEQPIAFCFIKPTRHSISTMDEGDVYTISFYTEAYRDALRYCGENSGRDGDKIKASGLTPIRTASGATAFSEAWMIIECKKIMAQPISDSSVVDKDVASKWSKDGYHKMYVGQILNVWIK